MAGTLRDQAYRYLSLEPLILCEIPPHPDFNDHANHHIGLKRFLFNVFKQAEAVDFENGWKSKEKAVDLTKPERRSKRINNKSWLARRSYVDRHEISSGDLDALLAQDHCRKEATYSRNVYDANELIRWDPADLIVDQDTHRSLRAFRVNAVQMSIYEMFHCIPDYPFMQDRVFHVLVLTVHSGYVPPGSVNSTLRPQSHTVQLPVDSKAFNQIDVVMRRSHYDRRTHCYSPGAISWDADTPPELRNSLARQQDYTGHRLTEGRYVSLERVRPALFGDPMDSSPTSTGKASRPRVTSNDPNRNHVWDMATLSDAGGMARITPWFLTRREIFKGIVKDVEEVLDLHRRNNTETETETVPYEV